MDAKDHGELSSTKNSICSLEWIAWAMEAARRHKEAEHEGDVESLDADADGCAGMLLFSCTRCVSAVRKSVYV